jgi:hypothetical protein
MNTYNLKLRIINPKNFILLIKHILINQTQLQHIRNIKPNFATNLNLFINYN